MQTRILGGEAGRRGFFGGRQNRSRAVGLTVVAVAGAFATVLLKTVGLVGALAAAAVVLLATMGSHRGTPWVRWQARRRWKWRRKTGMVDFVPVQWRPGEGDAPAVLGADREGGYGHDVPRNVTAAAWRDWPDGAEGMHWLQRGRGRPGILWHTPTGEQAYISVAYAVEGQVRGIESDAYLTAAATAWGDFLARYGSPAALPGAVQVLTRVVPVDSAWHEAWVQEQLDADAPAALVESYDEVVQLTASRGLMQRHLVVVRWPLTPSFIAAAARRGPAQAGWLALMRAEVASVRSHLNAAKLGPARALSAAQLAAVLRHMQMPSWPIDQVADVDVDVPWLASHDELSATVVHGAGPSGEPEQWWHRTAVITIEAVETSPRTSLWVAPLLSQMAHPIVRTVSLQMEVVPAAEARRGARMDITADEADLQSQREKGVLTDDELAVRREAARSRLEDLRPGSGHHGVAWTGHLTISARTRADLIDATAKITEAANNAGIAWLEWLDTQQAAASACTWPLARGMRPVGADAGTRLRRLLAGTGSKEGI